MLSFPYNQLIKLPKAGSMSAVARVLGVPVPTVRRWILDQNAPALVQIVNKNSNYVIKKVALIKWLKETNRVKMAKRKKAKKVAA